MKQLRSASHTVKSERLHHAEWSVAVCRSKAGREEKKLKGRRKNGRITQNRVSGETKGSTLRQMREEQGRSVIRRFSMLVSLCAGKWKASGLRAGEQLKFQPQRLKRGIRGRTSRLSE